MEMKLVWLWQSIAAVVLALPVAWNRETQSHIMGLRTFPLVSLGACAYIIIGNSFIGPDSPEAMARIIQGLLSGIGFVGGGAILKNRDHVRGTASAASIWVTGALGTAIGLGFYAYAVVLSILNFIVVYVFGKLKPDVDHSADD